MAKMNIGTSNHSNNMLFDTFFRISALLIIIFYPIYAAEKRPDKRINQWKVDRVDCTAPLCEQYSCGLNPVDRYTQLISMNCTRVLNWYKVMRIHFRLFYRYQRYRPFLLDVDYDLCDYLGNRTKFQPLMETVMPDVIRASNINHPCPFGGDLFLTNFSLRRAFIKDALIPGGQYRLDIILYNYVLEAATIILRFFVTVPSGGTTDDMAMG